MATTPAFANTVHNAAAKLDTGETDLTGATTTNIKTVFTAGASGSKIEEIVVQSDGNPADSIVMFFLYDGSVYYPFDAWDIGDPAAGSTTVAPYHESRTYENLILQSGWSLRALITVTPTSGKVIVHAFGGDF